MDGSPPPEERRSNGGSARSVGSSHGSPAFWLSSYKNGPPSVSDACVHSISTHSPPILPHQPTSIHICSSPPLPTSTMEVEVVGVYSLEDAEELVSRRGDEEEVEVKVHKCMLRDVPQLREMLREQIQERHWGVVNLSRLREFVPIDEAVGTAAELLGGVSREPPHRIIEAAQARAQELQVVAGRLTGARMRWAQGLGRRLQILAAVMAGHKSPSVLLSQVVDARGRCRKVSERKISTVPVRRGANLVEQYMENLHKQ